MCEVCAACTPAPHQRDSLQHICRNESNAYVSRNVTSFRLRSGVWQSSAAFLSLFSAFVLFLEKARVRPRSSGCAAVTVTNIPGDARTRATHILAPYCSLAVPLQMLFCLCLVKQRLRGSGVCHLITLPSFLSRKMQAAPRQLATHSLLSNASKKTPF